MCDDYGKKIAVAFSAIDQLNRDVSRLLKDCDGTIGKDKTSVFGTTITRDVSKVIDYPTWWTPYFIYRFYDARKEQPGLVEGVTIYYRYDSPKHDEPLLIVGQLLYKLERRNSTKPSCEEWDLWSAHFAQSTDSPLNGVVCRRDNLNSRLEWIKFITVPLCPIQSMEEVVQLMDRVRATQI